MGKVNLYDWSQAPDWANWAATNGSGESFWYEEKPLRNSMVNYWIKRNNTICQYFSRETPRIMWDELIEQRPK